MATKSESPSVFSSSSPPPHASEQAVLASTHHQKEKPILDFDLNYPPPRLVEVEDYCVSESNKGQAPEDAVPVIAIDLDGAQYNEGSIKTMRGLEEASVSLSKRRRYTAEEKGKRKVYEVVGDDDGGHHDQDNLLELRLGFGPSPSLYE